MVDLPALDRALFEVWYFRFDKRLDQLAASLGRVVGPDTVGRATLAFYEFARRQDPERFYAAMDHLNVARRAFGPFFADYDVWLTPTCAQVAQPNGVYGMDVDLQPEEFLQHEQRPCQYMVIYNVAGTPAISLPLAQHSNGLPIGLQFGAGPAREHVLVGLAGELEEALPWVDRVPPLHVSTLPGTAG